MTIRTTNKRAGRQAETSISRCTLRDFDDDHNMMEIKTADVMHSESHTDFERWQQVGMTVHPMPQDKKQQQQQPQAGQGGQGGGGAGGNGQAFQGNSSPWNKQQPKEPSAEGIMLYLNGSRSHPVCVAIDDRRHRPYQTKPGEAMFYAADGSGQTIYHRVRGDGKDGLYLLTLDDQQQQSSGGGAGAQATAASGSSGGGQGGQQRFISIRHVEKQKQQRKGKLGQQAGQGGQGGQGGSGGSQQSGQQGQQDYKHEGDSVNTEQKLSKQKIEYFDGSTNVGHYDRGNKDWLHHDGQGATHSMRADQNHSHIKHDGNHIWVDSGNCWSSKPIQIKSDQCS